jgi:hypothetical protein
MAATVGTGSLVRKSSTIALTSAGFSCNEKVRGPGYDGEFGVRQCVVHLDHVRHRHHHPRGPCRRRSGESARFWRSHRWTRAITGSSPAHDASSHHQRCAHPRRAMRSSHLDGCPLELDDRSLKNLYLSSSRGHRRVRPAIATPISSVDHELTGRRPVGFSVVRGGHRTPSEDRQRRGAVRPGAPARWWSTAPRPARLLVLRVADSAGSVKIDPPAGRLDPVAGYGVHAG